METKSAHNAKKPINLRHILKKLPARLFLPLIVTVAASLVYSGILNLGIFPEIQNPALHDAVFCVIELLLLCLYWHYAHRYARRCRHHSYTKAELRLSMCIVFVLFSAVCLEAYFLLPGGSFVRLFRLTLNLSGLCFRAELPQSQLPWLSAFLGVSLLVLLLEPFVTHKLYRRFHRDRSGGKRFRLNL